MTSADAKHLPSIVFSIEQEVRADDGDTDNDDDENEED